jgi:DNA-binding winged helix-turn-helix (wHTH) protein
MQLSFARHVIDCERFELCCEGARVDVQPKVWSFLRLLAENAHRVVSKDEIQSRLWPDVAVTESSLQRLASLARAALGDGELLRTVRGVGYQLAAHVEHSEEGAVAPAPTSKRVEVPDSAPMAPQQIRFCQSSDGVHIA